MDTSFLVLLVSGTGGVSGRLVQVRGLGVDITWVSMPKSGSAAGDGSGGLASSGADLLTGWLRGSRSWWNLGFSVFRLQVGPEVGCWPLGASCASCWVNCLVSAAAVYSLLTLASSCKLFPWVVKSSLELPEKLGISRE